MTDEIKNLEDKLLEILAGFPKNNSKSMILVGMVASAVNSEIKTNAKIPDEGIVPGHKMRQRLYRMQVAIAVHKAIIKAYEEEIERREEHDRLFYLSDGPEKYLLEDGVLYAVTERGKKEFDLPGMSEISNLSMSPDRSRLLFQCKDEEAPGTVVYVMKTDGSCLQVVKRGEDNKSDDYRSCYDPVWFDTNVVQLRQQRHYKKSTKPIDTSVLRQFGIGKEEPKFPTVPILTERKPSGLLGSDFTFNKPDYEWKKSDRKMFRMTIDDGNNVVETVEVSYD
jgi:hypothetical protein